MCGYVGYAAKPTHSIFNELGIKVDDDRERGGEYFPGTVIRDVIIQNEFIQNVPAFFWFLLEKHKGYIRANRKVTCFINARNQFCRI